MEATFSEKASFAKTLLVQLHVAMPQLIIIIIIIIMIVDLLGRWHTCQAR